MALHTDLPIHRTGVQLLQFAFKAQEHMPRGVKRSLGDKIADVCVEMLDQMALANATRGGERAHHLHQLLKHHRALTVLLRVGHDARYITTAVCLTANRSLHVHSARPCTSGVRAWQPVAPAAKAADRAAFLRLARSMAARAGGRKACRNRSAGARSANPFGLPPSWQVGAAVQPTAPTEPDMHQLSVKEERTIARARSILERQLRSADLPRFDAPTAVKAYLSTRFAGIDHEQVHALYLNAQHVLIAAEVAAIGSLTHASLSPREIARAALRHNAAAVILAHNHPSGLAEPSRADMMLTEAVRAALGLVEVRLLDHVVVAAGVVVSASERGRL